MSLESADERPLLILKTGCALPATVREHGDFERWIAEGVGVSEKSLHVTRVFDDETLPEAEEVAGVVVTGSSALVSAREPWSERAAAWLRDAALAGTPVLGICYGHQLLAHALGGRVGPNPRGRQVGTLRVELHAGAADDALLGGLPDELVVHATHVESVLELPPGARSLASHGGDPHQAFAVGECAWGVQFHPEFDAERMRSYLAARRDVLAAEAYDVEALRAEVRETPHGAAILRRFARILGY